MSTWESEIFSAEANTDFLDDLAQLESDEILEAVRDAVLLASDGNPSEEERLNGLAAATIAAIWSGAPFSAGEIAENYPFIRSNSGEISEKLAEAASGVLESADPEGDTDVDQFIEALS
ncbi:DUF4259 domain-containing protein [Corynebacterium sp. TA-R-1]|uniref:DUF4259 domain-containing protein n=1 Tax=Corynebacterium stercoris TaxID=2943490 RepID=A0ABT1G1R9_9CORY|nr:DUF4259 domain-containing protein [Corynebacterium stercoris]MCP1387970.1 DUF4259 domain-containing protein [Corynebacterium stercoris]